MNNLTSADYEKSKNDELTNGETFIGCSFIILILIGIYFIFFKNDDEVPDFTGTTIENYEKIADKKDIIVVNESNKDNDSWVVCYQNPLAGEKLEKETVVKVYSAPDCNMVDSDGNIDFNMGNVVGKIVTEFDNYNDDVIPYDLNIIKTDATGTNRSIWNSDNWIVCTQSIPENTKIKNNDTLTIEYARDFNECNSRQVEDNLNENSEMEDSLIGENSNQEILPEPQINDTIIDDVSLQTSTVYSLCREKFEIYYPDLKAHWIIGVRYNEMSSENLMFDIPWDSFIQLNVDIKDTDNVEYMCRVSGDENTPMIVEDRIIY